MRGPVWMVLLALPLAPPLWSAAEPQEDAEKLARELVRLKVENAQEETAWRTDRELLGSMVAMMQDKAAQAEEKLELAKARTAKDRDELAALRARTEGARQDLATMEARLAAVAARLVALRPNLPPRLSEALEMSYRTLADSAQPPAERLRVAMNILNRCAQFNRLVTVGEDVFTPAGEPAAKSFEVIYWGLNRGYAIDRAARRAWLGSPGAAGWQWEPRPEAFDRIVRLIATASDQADPAYELVPAATTRLVAPPAHGATP